MNLNVYTPWPLPIPPLTIIEVLIVQLTPVDEYLLVGTITIFQIDRSEIGTSSARAYFYKSLVNHGVIEPR